MHLHDAIKIGRTAKRVARPFKVVVITGASAGIGRATALAFAKQGADVALLARDRARLTSLQNKIETLGRRALPITLDVADPYAVDAAADEIEATLGPIDVWVNNAMASVFSPVIDMQAEEYRRVTDVTYLGAVYGTLAALRRMRQRNRGRIVLVGSALAYRGIPLQSAYCAAKHALQGFNDSLQSELRHDKLGVRVTMVQLSAFNTPQFDWSRSRMLRRARPMGAVFQPEIAARAIVWAARRGKREMIVGAPAWFAIWMNKFFPSAGDWYFARTGYDGQQTNEIKDPRVPDNLFDPVPGDYGAHGRFDSIARNYSIQFWLTLHKRSIAVAAIALGLAALAWFYG